MKKFKLALLVLGIACAIMACKKNTADPGKNTGNTVTETSESGEAATNEPMKTVESFQIELNEDQVGTVSPN